MKINNDEIFGLSAEDQDNEESFFSWRGCDNCSNGLGSSVYEYRAHFWTDKSERKSDFYEVQLCGTCLCAYYNGDDLDEDCKNVFQI